MTGPPGGGTVTVNDAPAPLPARSAALQLTVVVPIGNVDPDAGAQTATSAPSTGSVAVTGKLTFAPLGPVAAAVMSAGTTITGGDDSATVTTNDAVAVFPIESVAAQFTVVVAIANVDPDAGVQITGTVPSRVSVADAV